MQLQRVCGWLQVEAFRYSRRADYQPIRMARLAAFVRGEADFDMRWRLVVEFLKEYHQEPVEERQRLLADTPEPVGDLRWDVLFAGLAEHLAMRDGQDAPLWSASRGLKRFWFPFDTPGAHRPWSMLRPPSGCVAYSLPTTRSTRRSRGPLRVRGCCHGPRLRLPAGYP